MIYEFRTYTLHPRTLPEVIKRFGDALERRVAYSQLAAFWYTEIGPLNQIVHVWPYENALERSKIRAQVVKDGVWPPKLDSCARGSNFARAACCSGVNGLLVFFWAKPGAAASREPARSQAQISERRRVMNLSACRYWSPESRIGGRAENASAGGRILEDRPWLTRCLRTILPTGNSACTNQPQNHPRTRAQPRLNGPKTTSKVPLWWQGERVSLAPHGAILASK